MFLFCLFLNGFMDLFIYLFTIPFTLSCTTCTILSRLNDADLSDLFSIQSQEHFKWEETGPLQPSMLHGLLDPGPPQRQLCCRIKTVMPPSHWLVFSGPYFTIRHPQELDAAHLWTPHTAHLWDPALDRDRGNGSESAGHVNCSLTCITVIRLSHLLFTNALLLCLAVEKCENKVRLCW